MDKVREALCDAAMQPSLDAIVKAAIAHGVEDAPNPKNEMRHKRIASMVRALFAERWQAAQSVPVVGEPYLYVRSVHEGWPEYSKEDEFSDGKGGGLALYLKPTHSISAAELERLRKDAERWRKANEGGLYCIAEWNHVQKEWIDLLPSTAIERVDAAIAAEGEK